MINLCENKIKLDLTYKVKKNFNDMFEKLKENRYSFLVDSFDSFYTEHDNKSEYINCDVIIENESIKGYTFISSWLKNEFLG